MTAEISNSGESVEMPDDIALLTSPGPTIMRTGSPLREHDFAYYRSQTAKCDPIVLNRLGGEIKGTDVVDTVLFTVGMVLIVVVFAAAGGAF